MERWPYGCRADFQDEFINIWCLWQKVNVLPHPGLHQSSTLRQIHHRPGPAGRWRSISLCLNHKQPVASPRSQAYWCDYEGWLAHSLARNYKLQQQTHGIKIMHFEPFLTLYKNARWKDNMVSIGFSTSPFKTLGTVISFCFCKSLMLTNTVLI